MLLTAVWLVAAGCADILTDPVDYGAIEVQTTRRSGEPVSGVELTLSRWPNAMDVAVMGARGIHRFEFVPPDNYAVRAEPPDGYIRPEILLGGASTATVHGIILGEGDVASVAFQYLKVGPGRIDVTLREPDGTPVAEVPVELFSPRRTLATGRSDATGTVSFHDVPFGNVAVRARPPLIYLDEGEVTVLRQGLIMEDGLRLPVLLSLERCVGTIQALVLREATGEAVAGHAMRLYSPTATLAETSTDADGLAVFDEVPCRGSFGVALIQEPGWLFEQGFGKSHRHGITVSRGSVQTFDFTVTRCAGEVDVTVVDGSGQPVGNARLDLYNASEVVSFGRSDAGGRRTFGDVGCGVGHGVRVGAPTGFSVPHGRGSSFVDGILFKEPGVRRAITFTLQATG